MKKIALSLSVALAVLASGCATTGGFAASPSTPEAQQAKADRQQANRAAAGKGFLQGCAGGAIAGLLTGKGRDALKGCVAGGVIVGGVAWFAENQRQLKEAEAIAAQARASGATATVKTSDRQVKDEQGQVKTVPTLETLTIQFPPKSLAARTDSTRELLRKAAVMAEQSKTPVTINVYATGADQDWIVGELDKTLTGKTTVRAQAGAPARLELSPVPSL